MTTTAIWFEFVFLLFVPLILMMMIQYNGPSSSSSSSLYIHKHVARSIIDSPEYIWTTKKNYYQNLNVISVCFTFESHFFFTFIHSFILLKLLFCFWLHVQSFTCVCVLILCFFFIGVCVCGVHFDLIS